VLRRGIGGRKVFTHFWFSLSCFLFSKRKKGIFFLFFYGKWQHIPVLLESLN